MCPGQTLSCPVLADGPGPSCSTEIFLEWESVHASSRSSCPSLCPILCSVCPCLQLLPYSSNKPSVLSIPHHLTLSPGQVWGVQVNGSKFSTIIIPVPGSQWPHSTAESHVWPVEAVD